MTPEIKPLVAGNWKMNGTRSSLGELQKMVAAFDQQMEAQLDLLVCVPATLIMAASEAKSGSSVLVGGQDCHFNESGAHTGDISSDMISDAGGNAVIVGHSERRTDHGEDNTIVRAKAEAGLRSDLLTIVCIGETEEERKSGKTLSVLKSQLDGSMPDTSTAATVVVAYEPVWAIGTGLVPSVEDVTEAHAFIRSELEGRYGADGGKMRILYGGSVKPGNAVELMGVANVDGALVGGASLKADDFLGICAAYNSLIS